LPGFNSPKYSDHPISKGSWKRTQMRENTDRLYESKGEELERVGYDMELAGAYLLGRDAHSLTNEANRARLAEALSEPMVDSLVTAMTRMRGSLEDHTQYSAALLSGLLRGLKPLPDVGDL
jgi:predicted nucleotidyltransferase